MIRLSDRSGKSRLPSGAMAAPWASLRSSLTNCTFVPPATTLGMSGATVSLAGGGGSLAAPRPRPRPPPPPPSSSWAHASVDPSRQHAITISAFDFIGSPRVLNCEGRLLNLARAARTSSAQSLAQPMSGYPNPFSRNCHAGPQRKGNQGHQLAPERVQARFLRHGHFATNGKSKNERQEEGRHLYPESRKGVTLYGLRHEQQKPGGQHHQKT